MTQSEKIQVIRKDEFSQARTIIDERLRDVLSDDFIIRNGAGADYFDAKVNRALCIMEATAYILGYEEITAEPPCTSAVIRSFIIELNDSSISDADRKRLLDVVPEIINTAPTKPRPNGIGIMTNIEDPDYQEAEVTRIMMVRDFEDADMSMEDYIYFIRELAAVAKFDTKGD